MATHGRNSPGNGQRRSDRRPGGQRGFKKSSSGDRASPEALNRRAAKSPLASKGGAPSRRKPAAEDVRPSRGRPGASGKSPPRSTLAAKGDAPPRARGGPHGEPERLQKVLSRMGLASRREAEEWIRAGRITVNGEVAVLGTRVGRTDHLRLDGRLIHRHEVASGQVYMCHRSPGENLRTPDEASEHEALLDRLPRKAGNRFITVSPMPRVDGGLEIVTSDGGIAVQLQRTVHSFSSEFSVRVRGELEERTITAIKEGTLDRGVRLEIESCEASGGEAANRWYTLVARGGSGKDVRQLFERHGALVSRVLRTRLGPITLDRHLSRGQFRPLTKEEIEALTSPPSPDEEATTT